MGERPAVRLALAPSIEGAHWPVAEPMGHLLPQSQCFWQLHWALLGLLFWPCQGLYLSTPQLANYGPWLLTAL